MTTIDAEILATLLATRDNAYAPYSDFRVAAVAVSADGRRHAGCNVEVAHYKSTCAEASAISAMAAAGQHALDYIYILGSGSQPCAPCGDCRQRIREFARPGARVVLVDDRGRELARYTIEELLPDAFGPPARPGD